MIKKQYRAQYQLLDGSPRELWPIYATNKQDALEQTMQYVTWAVSKTYDVRNIKII